MIQYKIPVLSIYISPTLSLLIDNNLRVSFFAVNDTSCSSFVSWRCDNGQCIDFVQRCNGIADCTDQSDESVRECVSFQCAPNKFRCAYGACVNETAECDQHRDCMDNSDELTAKCLPNLDVDRRGNCSVDSFQCSNGTCISLEDLCDGKADCSDASDETVEQCASKCCPPFGFRCGYGACVDERVKCDGVRDCLDGSDENDYLCGRHNPSHRRKPGDKKHGTSAQPRPEQPTTTQAPPVPSAGAKVQCFSYPGVFASAVVSK